jgi:hypothetical protein
LHIQGAFFDTSDQAILYIARSGSDPVNLIVPLEQYAAYALLQFAYVSWPRIVVGRLQTYRIDHMRRQIIRSIPDNTL